MGSTLGKCYRVSEEAGTFEAPICKSLREGATLVAAHNEDEMRFLENLKEQIYEKHAWVWIGLWCGTHAPGNPERLEDKDECPDPVDGPWHWTDGSEFNKSYGHATRQDVLKWYGPMKDDQYQDSDKGVAWDGSNKIYDGVPWPFMWRLSTFDRDPDLSDLLRNVQGKE